MTPEGPPRARGSLAGSREKSQETVAIAQARHSEGLNSGQRGQSDASQETGSEQALCPCKAHRPVLFLGGGSSGFKPTPGHINQPLPQTAHFSSLFSLCYKEQTPNAKGVRKSLLNEELGVSRIIQYHGIHNWQAFQSPHGCTWVSKHQEACETIH